LSDAEFDQHARTYSEAHKLNIAVTGELPEYFAAYKMNDFADAVAKCAAKPDGRYLDFGSGIGASIRPFLEHFPRARLVCADVSKESLEQSRKVHGTAVDYIHASGCGLDIGSGSLDGAFACCVFHHIPPTNHGAVLQELRRVLKPGAPLMLYEHNPLNPLTLRAVRTCPLDENAVLISARLMKQLCEQSGFGGVRIEYRVFFPSVLKLLRPLESRLKWLPLGAQYVAHAQA
jgi:SAM-dependent methyltransferase